MRRVGLALRALALALVAGLLALLVYHFTARSPSPSGLRLAVIWPAGSQRTLATSSLRGRPTVLNFWASWCGPCKREAGLLRRTALQTRGRVTFVGLDARDFLRRHGMTYTVVKASETAISAYGVVNLPETIYLDARGHVVARTVGEVTARALTANLARLRS
jgi:cytochrome c biogenesis protein CcmG/thiol:disulfide interchange protein DsbE